jgi:hypothetical protein
MQLDGNYKRDTILFNKQVINIFLAMKIWFIAVLLELVRRVNHHYGWLALNLLNLECHSGIDTSIRAQINSYYGHGRRAPDLRLRDDGNVKLDWRYCRNSC